MHLSTNDSSWHLGVERRLWLEYGLEGAKGDEEGLKNG